MSAEHLSDALAKEGYEITGAGITSWERGESSPKTRAAVWLLDDLLNAKGELLALAGWDPGPDWKDRIQALEQDMAELKQSVAEILPLLRRLPDAPRPKRPGR